MMNPPGMGPTPDPLNTGAAPDDMPAPLPEQQPAPQIVTPHIQLSEGEEVEIVDTCKRFKNAVRQHSSLKKETMRKCYSYIKNKLQNDDLLPTPASDGEDRDNNQGRPQVFVPVCRQQLKTILSQLKLTFFPNDEDYFRVRAKTPEGVQFEDDLTEGLKYKFKEGQISEKIGESLYNLIWSGCMATFPAIQEETTWSWDIDEVSGAYIPKEVKQPPIPTLQSFNPLNFYVDPSPTDYDRMKWMYSTQMKSQALKDSGLYRNVDKLKGFESEMINKANQRQQFTLDDINDLSSTFQDTENNIVYDLYYFPYLKTATREYRNMMVGVAAETILVRFHPNMFPKGMNPVVFCNWMHDTDNPYGMGPIEDIKDLQKIINMLYNYMLEVAARTGNRFAVSPSVDTSNFFGVAGGMMVMDNPASDVVPLHGDFQEIEMIQNMIGVAKAEAQVTSGSQNPFQGSSNVDFKKTATELQILQENSISVLREVIEHVSIMGIQPILERLMYLCAELYHEPIPVRLESGQGGQAQFIDVDFSILKSGLFTIEVIGTNPSQSKQAQFNSLTQLGQLIISNPGSINILEPLLQKMGQLQGIKDINDLLDEIKQRAQGGQEQQNVPGQEGSVGPPQQPIVPGVPPSNPQPQG